MTTHDKERPVESLQRDFVCLDTAMYLVRHSCGVSKSKIKTKIPEKVFIKTHFLTEGLCQNG